MKFRERLAVAGRLAVTHLRSKLGIAVVAASTLSSSVCLGQLVLVSGTHNLQPNLAGQAFDLTVQNIGSSAVSVDTLNLALQIGDGGAAYGGTPAPSITGVDLKTGTVFASNGSQVDLGSTPQLAQLYITTQSGTVSLPPNQSSTLGRVTISTVGFNSAHTWNFNLAVDVPDLANPPARITYESAYELAGISPDSSVTVGTLTIVPEPNAVSAVGALLAAFAGVRRWRKGLA